MACHSFTSAPVVFHGQFPLLAKWLSKSMAWLLGPLTMNCLQRLRSWRWIKHLVQSVVWILFMFFLSMVHQVQSCCMIFQKSAKSIDISTSIVIKYDTWIICNIGCECYHMLHLPFLEVTSNKGYMTNVPAILKLDQYAMPPVELWALEDCTRC